MADLGEDQVAEIVVDTGVDPAGVPIVSVSGELDSSNAASLEATVAPLAAEHPERLIFDLSALRFMDSAGIAVLVGVAAKVDSVKLREPSEAVRRVIQLTGLSGVLPVESSS
ncbi:MAG TPA: STAS domain-containing protein [Solirubrobacteraceae bacterium]|nr:STAS domain-containing protein [Solirubrobacteraceae bacterium]